MSGSDRDDRPALIVLGLLVAAIVVVSLVGLYARHEANYQVGCYAPPYVNQDGQKQYEPVCPEDYLLFGDGVAQWVMALFALVATAVSWRALYLLRETFKETKRTADYANEALAADRAWLTVDDFQIREAGNVRDDKGVVYDRAILIDPVFRNVGRSPALQATIFRTTAFFWPAGDDKFQIPPIPDSAVASGNAVVPPGKVFIGAAAGMAGENLARFERRELQYIIHCLVGYRTTREPAILRISEVTLSYEWDGHVETPQGVRANLVSSVVTDRNRAT